MLAPEFDRIDLKKAKRRISRNVVNITMKNGLVWFYGISTIVGYSAQNPLYTYISNIWFGLVWFYGISTIVGYSAQNPLYTYISNIWFGLVWFLWHINHCRLFSAKSSLYIYIKYMIWFGLVLWHINHCRLFSAKSSLYIYIKYMIWFGLVWFYGISTIVGYSAQNPLYTYISNIYMICKHILYITFRNRAWDLFCSTTVPI